MIDVEETSCCSPNSGNVSYHIIEMIDGGDESDHHRRQTITKLNHVHEKQ